MAKDILLEIKGLHASYEDAFGSSVDDDLFVRSNVESDAGFTV